MTATPGTARRGLRAWWQRLRPTSEAPRPTALVLSGGGARASFQLGALRYLYDEVGIEPQIIAGTSAGAILGAMLAQAGDRRGQRAYLHQLDEMWRAMADSSEMFTPLPWFAQLRERGPVWLESLDRRPAIPRRVGLVRPFQRQEARQEAAGQPNHDGTHLDDSAVEADTPPWHPVKVLEALERLRILGRAGTEIVEILRGAQESRSMFQPGPAVEALLQDGHFHAERVANSGVALRVAVVALESGELRFVTEHGELLNRDGEPLPTEEKVDLVAAVRASCSIPMVLPPVLIGEEHYVDGGTRESLPADIAQRVMGADPCYAVLAGPSSGLAPDSSYADKNMVAVMMRATTAIMTDELQRDEAVAARRAGAVVIEPEFDIHETLTVTPGLTAIAIDYGYHRAAVAHLAASPEEQGLGREIFTLRRRLWRLEERLYAPASGRAERAGAQDTPPMDATAGLEAIADPQPPRRVTPTTQAELREHLATGKNRLHELVAQLPAAYLPPGARQWAHTWETHTFDIAAEPYWAAPVPRS